MLSAARLEAMVPVSNLDRAIEFYGQKLGLGTPQREDVPGNPGARFALGGATLLVYESVGAGQSRATIAGFDVDDIETAMERLREAGVTFEEYDMPNIKTENGIANLGDFRAAWFKDPDGNIIALGQGARVRAAV